MDFNFELKENKVNPTEFKGRVYSLLLDVLKERFNGIYSKQDVKTFKERFNFACPYCGDSKTDHQKKRGNIWLNSFIFKCYNGDCNERKSIITFMKDQGIQHAFSNYEIDFVVEQTRESKKTDTNTKDFKLKVEDIISIDLEKVLPTRQQIITNLRLFEIEGSPMETYLKKRFQTIDNRFAWQPKTQRLFIFNLSSCGTFVLSYQIKTFNDKYPYLTYGLEKIWTEVLRVTPTPELEENISKLNSISKIFNILNIDLTEPVTIFEGPLDCFLWTNAIAVSGVGNVIPIEIDNKKYLFDNDKAGIEKSIELIKKGEYVFLWQKFFNEHPELKKLGKIKDLNDVIIKSRINKIKITKMNIINCFSNNKLDIMDL